MAAYACTSTKIWLCIALEAAHEKLIDSLGRAPATGMPWIDFLASITPLEMELVGATANMLHLMGTGKKILNKYAHQTDLFSVATAVTATKKNSDTWRALFQFAYGEDAEEVVFHLDQAVDA